MNQRMPDVTLTKLIAATPRDVFEAWLDPEALAQFMCPVGGSGVSKVEVDARVGGKFLVVMNVAGKDLPHHGEYLVIERHTRLSFTWLSHAAGEGSQVSLRFTKIDDEHTELTLEHIGLVPDKHAAHNAGWTHILKLLAAMHDAG